MTLITTLIPAYKPTYLAEVFDGLARQRCQAFRVVVSDDSPGEEITARLRAGHFGAAAAALDIEIVTGPRHARLNMTSLIDRWGGSTPYAHLHLDDDLIYPEFYSSHLAAHAQGRFCASASMRWLSQLDTTPTECHDIPAPIAAGNLRVQAVDAQSMFQTMVPTGWNWVGEFTNMVISAEGARHWPRTQADEINYVGWPDVGFVLSAVQHLPLAFIHERLSVFRQHPAQTTHVRAQHGARVSHLAWAIYGLQAWAERRINDAQAVQAVSLCVRELLRLYPQGDPVIDTFLDLVQHRGGNLGALYAAVKPFWLALLASDPVTAPVVAPRPVAAMA
ncbi:MAG: hypothetical protein LCH73_02150 [Proteobacteria bacterium]|nr:hypothetical protein [Pseudomonadota bacterium]